MEKELDDDQMRQIEDFFGFKLESRPKLQFCCLDLTKNSPSKDLKGQILMAILPDEYITYQDERTLQLEGSRYSRNFRPSIIVRKPNTRLKNHYEDEENTYYSPDIEIDFDIDFSFFKCLRPDIYKKMVNIIEPSICVSYNGIAIPIITNDYSHSISLYSNYNMVLLGILYFGDSFRPDLSLARDELRGLSWNTYSTANLAFRRAIKSLGLDIEVSNIFSSLMGCDGLSLMDISKDPYMQKDGEWAFEPIIKTDSGKISLNDLRQRLQIGNRIELTLDEPYPYNFSELCAKTLAQLWLRVKFKISGKEAFYYVNEAGDPTIYEGLMPFPPIFFVPYENSDLLRYETSSQVYPLNQNHPFSKWLIEKAPIMQKKYAGMFRSIGYQLPRKAINEINIILKRLRTLDKEIRPPEDIDLKPEDFVR